MIWKKVDKYYDLSTAGLLRRRVGNHMYCAGSLVNPLLSNSGVANYNITRKGMKTKATVLNLMRYNGIKALSPRSKWVDAISKYVLSYNKILSLGFYEPTPAPGELSMWDINKYSDPWLTFKLYGANERSVTQTQMHPMG